MSIPREAVIWGYRFFLGRDPESEATITDKMPLTSPVALARALINSREFKEKGGMEALFGNAPGTAPTPQVKATAGIATIKISELPAACFINDLARQISGTVSFPEGDQRFLSRLRVLLHGSADPHKMTGVRIDLESIPDDVEVHVSNSGQQIHFGANCRGKWTFRMWGESVARVGRNSTSNGTEVFLCEGGKLTVGEDCMFATTHIHVGDSHAIFDVETSKTLNYSPAPRIHIENHVWLASRTTILADSRIGAGSIVGVGSVAKGDFAPASMILGMPAQTKKTGVSWTRSHDGGGMDRVKAMLR